MRNEIILPKIPYCSLNMSPGGTPSVRECCVGMHYHAELELLQVLAGSMDCVLQSGILTANAGDVIFINESIPHGTRTHIGTASRLIQFKPDNAALQYMGGLNYNMQRFLRNSKNDCVILKSTSPIGIEVNDILNKMNIEINQAQRGYELYLKGYLELLTGIFTRGGLLCTYNYNNDALIKLFPIIQYVDNNFKKDISLESVCEKFGINKSHFCRLFKKATNRTFVEYLNFVRVCEAQNMLHSMNESIMDISLECGFAGISYFNRTFKKITGCTPTEYRKIKAGEASKGILS